MTDIYKKTPGLIVAWFNILVCIMLPCIVFVKHWFDYKDRPEYFDSGMPRVIFVQVSVIPWLIATSMLVKGIKENRPKLMAAWIYLGYLMVVLGLGAIIYYIFSVTIWTGALRTPLMKSLPMIICWAIFTLSLIPVRKLYQRMSIPAPVEPTKVVTALQEPIEEEKPRYMPIFENF